MEWVTPKTDWSPNDNVTYEDMNRIAGNINFLYQQELLKADYTANDIVTINQWSDIVKSITDLSRGVGVDASMSDMDVTAENFNDVESLTLMTKEMFDLIFDQISANVYVGDDLCASTSPENYTRGV